MLIYMAGPACVEPGESDAAYERRVGSEMSRGTAELNTQLPRRVNDSVWVVPYSDLGYPRCAQPSCTRSHRQGLQDGSRSTPLPGIPSFLSRMPSGTECNTSGSALSRPALWAKPLLSRPLMRTSQPGTSVTERGLAGRGGGDRPGGMPVRTDSGAGTAHARAAIRADLRQGDGATRPGRSRPAGQQGTARCLAGDRRCRRPRGSAA